MHVYYLQREGELQRDGEDSTGRQHDLVGAQEPVRGLHRGGQHHGAKPRLKGACHLQPRHLKSTESEKITLKVVC